MNGSSSRRGNCIIVATLQHSWICVSGVQVVWRVCWHWGRRGCDGRAAAVRLCLHGPAPHPPPACPPPHLHAPPGALLPHTLSLGPLDLWILLDCVGTGLRWQTSRPFLSLHPCDSWIVLDCAGSELRIMGVLGLGNLRVLG